MFDVKKLEIKFKGKYCITDESDMFKFESFIESGWISDEEVCVVKNLHDVPLFLSPQFLLEKDDFVYSDFVCELILSKYIEVYTEEELLKYFKQEDIDKVQIDLFWSQTASFLKV